MANAPTPAVLNSYNIPIALPALPIVQSGTATLPSTQSLVWPRFGSVQVRFSHMIKPAPEPVGSVQQVRTRHIQSEELFWISSLLCFQRKTLPDASQTRLGSGVASIDTVGGSCEIPSASASSKGKKRAGQSGASSSRSALSSEESFIENLGLTTTTKRTPASNDLASLAMGCAQVHGQVQWLRADFADHLDSTVANFSSLNADVAGLQADVLLVNSVDTTSVMASISAVQAEVSAQKEAITALSSSMTSVYDYAGALKKSFDSARAPTNGPDSSSTNASTARLDRLEQTIEKMDLDALKPSAKWHLACVYFAYSRLAQAEKRQAHKFTWTFIALHLEKGILWTSFHT
ncbi:hypothetical protein C8J56DRAFT_1126807 [Mycena floridula]|nr:hypothetical protein C8J56DRAFT_1126807 [Mycena floridula]